MIRTILIAFATLLIGTVIGWQARYLSENDFDFSYIRQRQLNEAAGRGDLAGIQKLISAGADTNAGPTSSGAEEGSKPLMEASRSAQPEAVSLLLEHGAAVNYVDNDAATALGVAEYAKRRAEETIGILRAHGGKTFHELCPQ